MSTQAAAFEQLPASTRSNIRKGMIGMIRSNPRPNATFEERLETAVKHYAKAYGVQKETIRQVFTLNARVAAGAVLTVRPHLVEGE